MPALSSIKSIQRGVITLANGQATNTATINAVDVNKSNLFYLGDIGGDNTAVATGMVRIALTNSTTVTATRTSSTNAATVSYEVTEYY